MRNKDCICGVDRCPDIDYLAGYCFKPWKRSLMPTVTCTTQTEVKISPSVRKRLLTELKVYAEIVGQIKALEHAKDKHKEAIGAIREETGEQKLEIDGYSITLVAPIRKKFSPKKFVSLGGDLAIYNQAVEDVTSRSYEKISLPGVKEEE